MEMIEFRKLDNAVEMESVRQLIIKHLEETDSSYALDVLAKWAQVVPKFVKVVPTDYQVMLDKIELHKVGGLSNEEAALRAFTEVTGGEKLIASK